MIHEIKRRIRILKTLMEIRLERLKDRILKTKMTAEDKQTFHNEIEKLQELAESFDMMSSMESSDFIAFPIRQRMFQLYDMYTLIKKEFDEGYYDAYFEDETEKGEVKKE